MHKRRSLGVHLRDLQISNRSQHLSGVEAQSIHYDLERCGWLVRLGHSQSMEWGMDVSLILMKQVARWSLPSETCDQVPQSELQRQWVKARPSWRRSTRRCCPNPPHLDLRKCLALLDLAMADGKVGV